MLAKRTTVEKAEAGPELKALNAMTLGSWQLFAVYQLKRALLNISSRDEDDSGLSSI